MRVRPLSCVVFVAILSAAAVPITAINEQPAGAAPRLHHSVGECKTGRVSAPNITEQQQQADGSWSSDLTCPGFPEGC